MSEEKLPYLEFQLSTVILTALRRTTESPVTGTSEVIYKAQDIETPLVVVAGEGPTVFML